MMKIRKRLLFQTAVFVIMVLFLLAGCTDGNDVTDYSKAEHWLTLPSAAEKEVDIFYLYPTAWRKINEEEPDICEIDNPVMLKGAKAAFARQATAFAPVGNIYAPYYRQVDVASRIFLPIKEQEKIIGGIPTEDALAAFEYYMKHYNNGRPFILAGHSQGSNVMAYLLSEYMKENPKVYSRMIAAYVIGYSITDEYLAANPHLKFSSDPDDTTVLWSKVTAVCASSLPFIVEFVPNVMFFIPRIIPSK